MLGIILIVLGVILMFVAFLLPKEKFGDYAVGGFILIGPVPIVFGKGLKMSLLLMLVVVSLVIALSLILLVGVTG